jgi:surface antigen
MRNMVLKKALVFGFALIVAAPSQAAYETDQPVQIQHHWECVPIARALSGIQIRGDAHTWWGQAAGRYDRGDRPKRGAVMAFKPQGSMRLGHVAAISKVVDSRTVLLTHSNWSRINGRRGQIERNVRAIDVSPDNDWSQVKVWYAPLQDLGTTVYAVHGFIYPDSTPPMTLPVNSVVAKQPVLAKPAVKMANQSVSYPQPGFAPAPIKPKKEPKPTGRLSFMESYLKKIK